MSHQNVATVVPFDRCMVCTDVRISEHDVACCRGADGEHVSALAFNAQRALGRQDNEHEWSG